MKAEKNLKKVLEEAQQRISSLEKELLDTTQESTLLTFELIEEIEKKTKELEKAKRRYQSIFENAPIAIFIVDPETKRIREINPAGLKLTGYESEELREAPFWKVFFGEKEEVVDILENVKEKGSLKIDKRVILTKDKKSKFIEVIFSYHLYADRPLIQVIAQDITQRVLMEERLRELSLSDELTGLRNRRAFYFFIEQHIKTISQIIRGGVEGVLLLYIDVDNFKWINDTLGHKEGDRALIDVANLLKSSFRESDVIARIGGDEFAVLVIGAMEESKEVIIKRLKDKLREFNEKAKRPYKLSLSIGAVYYDPYNPWSIDELIKRADRAMYKEKKKKSQKG